jgi:hypothetical protein
MKTWKLTFEDESVHEFYDLRRKTGNQIIRAYLLEGVLKSSKVTHISCKMRGPKDEFQDFDNFLILEVTSAGTRVRILAESGVYENLRIVGTDNEVAMEYSRDEIIELFTNALNDPGDYEAVLTLSHDSKITTK